MFKNWLLGSAKDVITKIDASFMQNAKNDEKFVSKNDFRKITAYSSGHIPGYYMGSIIKRNGYLQELIEGADNPFHFFYLYNKAAKKDKEHPVVFSDKTIAYLHQLERKAYE